MSNAKARGVSPAFKVSFLPYKTTENPINTQFPDKTDNQANPQLVCEIKRNARRLNPS